VTETAKKMIESGSSNDERPSSLANPQSPEESAPPEIKPISKVAGGVTNAINRRRIDNVAHEELLGGSMVKSRTCLGITNGRCRRWSMLPNATPRWRGISPHKCAGIARAVVADTGMAMLVPLTVFGNRRARGAGNNSSTTLAE